MNSFQSYANAEVVTPSDSTDLKQPTRAIFVTHGGYVRATMVGKGEDVHFLGLLPGIIYPFAIRRALVAGTNAEIIALW